MEVFAMRIERKRFAMRFKTKGRQRDHKGKDAKGKYSKEKDAQGGNGLDPVGEQAEIDMGNYSSHAEREQSFGPAKCRDEYEYEQYWSAGNAWIYIYIDGAWREIRDPTKDDMRNIDGATQNLGLGEFAEYAYAELLTSGPKYVEFHMVERKKDHLDMKKFTV